MLKSKIEKILFIIIEYGIYFTLVSPLVVLFNYYFSFVSPKTLFFRIIVDIIFIAYIFLALLNPKYRPKINPLTIAITLFLIIVFLTSLTGVDFTKSFWSIFERMTGILTLLHLFVFYIILTSCFVEKKYWERFFLVSISVAVIISIVAFCEGEISNAENLSKLELIISNLTASSFNKGGSTLGNPSFLMSYLLFNIFFVGILIIMEKNIFWRIFLFAVLVLFLTLLFFNPIEMTRGAISSFCIGITLFITGIMFFSKNNTLKKLSLLFLVLMVIIGIFIVKNFHFKDRPFNILDIPDSSRKIVWKIAWHSIQERPLLGWGWENFDIPFAKHYDPTLPLTGDRWYDKVHNIVLDIAVSSGAFGLLIYLSIFGVAVLGLSKFLKKESLKEDIFISLLLISLLLVYFLQNLWVFDMISSYIMFFGTLAFISFLIYTQDRKKEAKTLNLSPFISSLLVLFTIFIFFYGNIQPARSAKEINNFIQEIDKGNIEKSIISFQKALQLSPMAQFEAPVVFYHQFSKLVSFKDENNVTLIARGLKEAEKALNDFINKNPYNVRMMFFLGDYYNFLYSITQKKEFSFLAENILQKAIEISHRNQQLYWLLAQAKFNQGKIEDTVFLAEKAISLEPKLLDSHKILIIVYLLTKNKEMALKKIEEALKINPEWKDELTKLFEFANLK